MRRLLPLLLAAPALAGCSLSARTLATPSASAFIRANNAADGTDLPTTLLMNGYEVGGNVYAGMVGVHYSRQEAAVGEGASRFSLLTKTYEFRVGTPHPRRFGPVLVFPMMGTGLRKVEARHGPYADDTPTFLLRPMVHVAVPLGLVILFGSAGYDLTFVNEALQVGGAAPLTSRTNGPTASAGVMLNLCPSC